MTNNNLQIVNLVMSGDLCIGELDPEQIADDLPLSNFTLLPGRVYLQKEDMPTINLYKSGKLSVAGSTSEKEAVTAIEWLIDQMISLGTEVDEESVKKSLRVEFLVLNGDLKKELNLEQLIEQLSSETSEYEPEQFPGIIYKPDDIGGTVSIFSTGKISITGVDNSKSAEQIYYSLLKIVDE